MKEEDVHNIKLTKYMGELITMARKNGYHLVITEIVEAGFLIDIVEFGGQRSDTFFKTVGDLWTSIEIDTTVWGGDTIGGNIRLFYIEEHH